MISDSTSVTTGKEIAQHAQHISGTVKQKQPVTGSQTPGQIIGNVDDSGLDEALAVGGTTTLTGVGGAGRSAIGEID